MRRVESRLAKLGAAVPKGCGVCRPWWEVAIVDDWDTTQRPERCPGCGRLVPVRTWVHVVGVPLDLL